ncbi:hypothetical protein COCOBI_09-1940 [Coccomyxa sp. Obi]|nr:hypothetical protein COCOBI_09-1940 [Coccomyxa sp. Obi]
MTGAEKIEKGDTVAWNWGGSSIQGEVTKKFTEHAEIESKGKTITRNGDGENPAYKVERPGKNPVLKKATELHKLEDDENPPSTEHVKTRRQKAMRQGKE